LPDGLETISKSEVIAESGLKLRRDIVKIKDWCGKWSMCLNSSKFKVMHFGRANPEMEYFIGSGRERVKIDKTETEKDLGMILNSDGKNARQTVKVINRANLELGRMRKTLQF
jgi:hypothetical protein